jgi:nucleoside-diphosphate-sugar epimerase
MNAADDRGKSRILVTGGTGVMGSRLVRALVKDGWRCRVLTLPGDPFISRLEGLDCEIVYGDITDARSLEGVFDNVLTVYHLAAIIIAHDPALFDTINTNGTRNIVEGALSFGARHFIYISSASVVYPKSTPYSRSKKACEDIVKQQKEMNYTIVRPTLVYERNGGQEFMMFRDYLMKYPVVPFIGKGHALKNPVDVDDLIQGLRAIVGNERCYGKTYNFSGGEDLSIWDLAHLILSYEGKKKLFVPIPVWVCTFLANIMQATMKRPVLTQNVIAGITQYANLDHSSATEDIGYTPIGIREGMKKYFSDKKKE